MTEMLLRMLSFPQELNAMLSLKFSGNIPKKPKNLRGTVENMPDLEFCYAVLNTVSRSFAVVIASLPDEIKDAVCLFYLILRGLDSVEDDMRPAHQPNKVRMLNEFAGYLEDTSWNITGVGDTPDYELLLEYFDKVSREYQKLDKGYREVIFDITKRMGAGMAEFAVKGEGGCASTKDYNLYCHYVAGLVGHGLVRLFAASGLEDPSLAHELELANQMGLFLQKTNIIRDYVEDLDDHRTWWPEDVWSKHGKTLASLRGNKDTGHVSEEAIQCLNELVTDALTLVPSCLKFLDLLKNQQIFAFCAIPQVMAMATLTKLYNNPAVMLGEVKIRKGLAARIMLESNGGMDTAKQFFSDFGLQLVRKIKKRQLQQKSENDDTKTTMKLALNVLSLARASDQEKAYCYGAVMLAIIWVVMLVTAFVFAEFLPLLPGGFELGDTAISTSPAPLRAFKFYCSFNSMGGYVRFCVMLAGFLCVAWRGLGTRRWTRTQAGEGQSNPNEDLLGDTKEMGRIASTVFAVLMSGNLALYLANSMVYFVLSESANGQETPECMPLREYVQFESTLSGGLVLACLANIVIWARSEDDEYTSMMKLGLAAVMAPCVYSCGYSISVASTLEDSACKAADLPLWRMAVSNMVITLVAGGIPFVMFLISYFTSVSRKRKNSEAKKNS